MGMSEKVLIAVVGFYLFASVSVVLVDLLITIGS